MMFLKLVGLSLCLEKEIPVDNSSDRLVPTAPVSQYVKEIVSPPSSAHKLFLAVVLPKFAMHISLLGIGNFGAIHGSLQVGGTSTQNGEGSLKS